MTDRKRQLVPDNWSLVREMWRGGGAGEGGYREREGGRQGHRQPSGKSSLNALSQGPTLQGTCIETAHEQGCG